ncbi:hypothetical protein V4C53_31150 [Paraburkholderia azotifigens]|uniref:hypothetical protein n=1 Tax=Paraburkholderia azotifigens TaxID=2057004 RepID=UPI0031745DE5
MKTNDSGRTTANARGSRSASADNGGASKAGITEAASTAYATYETYYVDAAPDLRHSADPAIHLRQRALLTPAGRRQRERALLQFIVAQVAKREAQRRERDRAFLTPAAPHAPEGDEAEAYGPRFRDPGLTD